MYEVSTSWSVKDYVKDLSPRQSGKNKLVEDRMRRKFRPIFEETRFIRKACTIMDSEGNFLLWYLPQAFMLNLVVSAHTVIIAHPY